MVARCVRLSALALDHLGLLSLTVTARWAVRRWPLASLLLATSRLDALRPTRAPLHPDTLHWLERATRRAARALGATCLPKALALRWWLRIAYGQPSQVLIGLRRDPTPLADPFIGHAWLLVTSCAGPLPLLHEPLADHGAPIPEATLLAALSAPLEEGALNPI
jgi:hypothetical protein